MGKVSRKSARMNAALIVRGPFRGAGGHDHHVREFVRHLAQRGIRQQLVDVTEWGSAALPPESRDPWFETLGKPVPAHATLHFCMPHQVRPARGQLNVNYTMFEADRIPEGWVRHNMTHDLVIVPTASSRDAWTARGFPAARVGLCPLGVDLDRFHPRVEPLALKDREGRPVPEYRTRVLNVSEISPRKNLLTLLRVWLRATARDDDAILIVKLGRFPPGGTVRLMRDLDAMERAIGRTRRESAPVLFSDQILSDAEMPRLFAAGTHYWSMSHGEGWDQPMVEAGATGLRLIAPMHTAYTAYLDASVARMIPARLVPARADGSASVGPLFEGARWWEPDEDAAADALHEAVRGHHAPPTARARFADLTWERATTRLLEILEELHREHGHRFLTGGR
jgi:glycosyltransferase involved in cell wall biosynthesis